MANRKLVVLDEINVALKMGYVSLIRCLGGLDGALEAHHVALKPVRGAPRPCLERADLVTEMRLCATHSGEGDQSAGR